MGASRMEVHTLASLGLAILSWASAFASIRAGLETFGPGHLTLMRFLVASFVLLIYALLTRMKLPETRDTSRPSRWPAFWGSPSSTWGSATGK